MKELKKHPDCARGTWWWGDGSKSPTISCPGCQALGGLDHEVFRDGTVKPSLICPKCHLHDNIKLLGWDHGYKDFREKEKK